MTATATTETADRPPVEEMYVVHRAFRREFGMVPGLVRDVAEGDTRRAAVVADHLQLLLTGLHMHHTGEDAVLWPRLLERAAPSAELVETMQEQHDRVDAYADRIEPLLAQWRGAASAVRGEQLARLVEEFTTALLEHLGFEEREILPLCSQHISLAEWRSLGEHGREEMSPRQLPIFFGAVLEQAGPDERRLMLEPLPWPVRLLLLTWGRRTYRRYITAVRAG